MDIFKEWNEANKAFDNTLVSLRSSIFWEMLKWNEVDKLADIFFFGTINDNKDTHPSDDVFILLLEVFKHLLKLNEHEPDSLLINNTLVLEEVFKIQLSFLHVFWSLTFLDFFSWLSCDWIFKIHSAYSEAQLIGCSY